MKSPNSPWCVLRVLLIALVLLATGSFALAQVSASLSGRVEDASGAGIPGAVVTVTSEETGVARTVTSDEGGNYRVLSLQVGRYDAKAEKAGFKVKLQEGINLVVGQEASVTLTLEVGQVQQEVTVTAEAPLVNTSTASIDGLVGEKAVKELPLNGRSFDMLIALDTGVANVTSTKAAGAGAQVGNLFSVSGRHFGENLFLMNGVEYTGPSQVHSVPGGVSGQLLGIDAVREFNVVENTYGAEYGKRAGAQISVVTQSGTNQLHGTAFEFLRNSALDAKNYFDQPIGERIPPFERNQFGGALGGPIRKDKTFVFGNYEGFRQRLGVSDVSIVPDANARLGLLPCNTITPLPSGCSTTTTTPTKVPNLNAGILPYFNAYWPTPTPNTELGGGIAKNFSNPLQHIREDFGTARVDHTFSDKDTLGVNYLVDDGVSLSPQANPFWGQDVAIRSQVLSIQETHVFSPNVINTLTAGFSRASFKFQTPPLTSFPSNLVWVPGQFPGRISIGGGGSGASSTITVGGGSIGSNLNSARNPYTFADGVQIIKGRHQISAGVWFQDLQSNEFSPKDQGGVATFTTLESFLQATVASFVVAPNTTALHWRQLEGAWYLQDVIQLRPNLTVRVGLRHEFTNGWNEAEGKASNFIFGSNGVLLTTPVVGNSPYTVNNSKWLFSPRVGIAWDPFGRGKTSVRAGFGTYYDIQDVLGNVLDGDPPFNGVESFTNASFLSLVPINPATPLPAACGPGAPANCTKYAPSGILSTAKTPTVEEWNLTVEQQVTPNTSVSLGYVGSRGYHEEVNADANAIAPQVCAAAAGCVAGGVSTSAKPTVPLGTLYVPVTTLPNPNLAAGDLLIPEGYSSYNALVADLTHRFSYGLQFRVNYTYSRLLNIQSGFSGDEANESSFLENPYNTRMDWGLAPENKTNKFVFSGGYELPIGRNKPWLSGLNGVGEKVVSGWQLNWIETISSGFPFDTEDGSNRSGNGDTGNPDRPSFNTAFTGPLYTGNPNQWFNPSAFVLPAVGTFGNVGRDALIGPNLRELDLSLFKTTAITEKVNLQFRAEAFNILNRANFNTPAVNVFSGAAVSPSAGVITSTATSSRQLQFGLKLIF